MARHCPVCGKGDDGSFVGELCQACAIARLPEFPAVRLSVCSRCGLVVDRGSNRKDATLEEEVVRLLRLKQKGGKFLAESGEVEFDFGGARVKKRVEILQAKAFCSHCARAGSRYFEAIIQLRGPEGRVKKNAERIIARLGEKTFIPKIEEQKTGIDIYVGSRNEALSALNAFELGFLRTEKLAGQRDGKRLYRTTLLVRL